MVFFSAGWTPLQALYPAEVLSYENRAKGLALQGWVTNAVSTINTFGMPIALREIGYISMLTSPSSTHNTASDPFLAEIVQTTLSLPRSTSSDSSLSGSLSSRPRNSHWRRSTTYLDRGNPSREVSSYLKRLERGQSMSGRCRDWRTRRGWRGAKGRSEGIEWHTGICSIQSTIKGYAVMY